MYRNLSERLYEIQAVIEETEAPSAVVHRNAILSRLVRIIREQHGDPRKVYLQAIRHDWVAYAALDLTTREGLPFLYSQWQEKANDGVEEYDDFLLMNARQIGKSTFAAGEYLKRMMRQKNRRVLHVAPTEKQLEVRDMVRHYIENSDFIRDQYVRKDGKLGVEEILFAENGSHFEAMNLSITHSAGDTKRGKSATDMGIDEIQMVSQEAQEAAIDPMLSNALPGIRRRIIRYGTFSYKYRPDFDRVVDYAQRSTDVGYLNVTCWTAMDDGIRRPDGPHGMRARFEKLNIPCNYVRTTGVCPRALPHWYDDLTDVKPAIELKTIQHDEFECNLVCFNNDTYVAEDLAQAPALGDRFFTKEWLIRSSQRYRFWGLQDYQLNQNPLIASADIGKLQDPTEIVIQEIVRERDPWGALQEKLRVVGNVTVEPYSAIGGEKPSYDRIVDAIKRVDKMAQPISWYIDITRNEELLNLLLAGNDALEPGVFYSNEAALKNELRGIWWNGPDKARMFENHQRMIAEGRLVVPNRESEPVFFEKFFDDHTAVRRKENSQASYTVFERTGHLVDSMAMGSLYLLDGRGGVPASYEFYFGSRF